MTAPTCSTVQDRAAAVALAVLGDGDLAAAVAVALGEAGLLAADPPQRGPAVVAVRPPSRIEQTIARRTVRQSCGWPSKAAYNPAVPAEAEVIERRRGAGMSLYRCGCGWHHLGHDADLEGPPPPPLPAGSPIVWAREKRHVELVNGAGVVEAAGVAESYCDVPTMRVRVNGDLVTWVADLVRPDRGRQGALNESAQDQASDAPRAELQHMIDVLSLLRGNSDSS